MKALVTFFLCSILTLNAKNSSFDQLKLGSIIELDNHQHFEHCNHINSFAQPTSQFAESFEKRPYDVIGYDIFLDWEEIVGNGDKDLNAINYDATVEIRFVLEESNLTEFEFDASELVIHQVWLNRVPQFSGLDYIVNLDENDNSTGIKIFNTRNFRLGDTLTARIEYSKERVNNKGFHFYTKGTVTNAMNNGEARVMHNIAYTMSQPEFARFWVPCNDHPHDKALVKISGRVPSDNTFLSNGILQEVIDTNNAKIYVWQDTDPMPPYLMIAVASKYQVFEQYYKRISNPEDSIEVFSWAWAEDFEMEEEQGELRPKYAFRNTVRMLEFFSEIWGEYPNDKYGTATIDPFWAGGMEHQTMTTVNRRWLMGFSDWGIAHEVAHHWIGNYLTCATWDDLWINEGGASYSEALWAEFDLGLNRYEATLLNFRNRYFNGGGANLPPSYAVPTSQVFAGATPVIYHKPGLLFAMAREMYGKDEVNLALKNTFQKYAYSNATSLEFITSMKEEIGDDVAFPVDQFFSQWVLFQGHPVFDVSIIATDDWETIQPEEYTFDITLNQIQEQLHSQVTNINPEYTMMIKVEAVAEDEALEPFIIDILVDKKEFATQLAFPFLPKNIVLKEAYGLFQIQNLNLVLSVEDEYKQQIQPKLYPNPATKGETIWVVAEGEIGIQAVDIYNSMGQFIETYIAESTQEGWQISINTQNLNPGVYFVRSQKNNSQQSTAFIVN